jgi:hypothetical protein
MLNEQALFKILKHNFNYVLEHIDYNSVLNTPIKKEEIKYFTVDKSLSDPAIGDSFIVKLPYSIGLKEDVLTYLTLDGKPLFSRYEHENTELGASLFPHSINIDGNKCLMLSFDGCIGSMGGPDCWIFVYDKVNFDYENWVESYDPDCTSIVLSYYCDPSYFNQVTLTGLSVKKLDNIFLEDDVVIQNSLNVPTATAEDVNASNISVNNEITTSSLNAYSITATKIATDDNDVITKKYLENNFSTNITSQELLEIADMEYLIYDVEFKDSEVPLDRYQLYWVYDSDEDPYPITAVIECTYEDGTVTATRCISNSSGNIYHTLSTDHGKLVRARLATTHPGAGFVIRNFLLQYATKVNHLWLGDETEMRDQNITFPNAIEAGYLHIDGSYNNMTYDSYIHKMFTNSILKKIDYLYLVPRSLSSTFSNDSALEEIGTLEIDYKNNNGTSLYNMFYECTSLRIAPKMNTGIITSMQNLYYGCVSLEKIEGLDVSSVDTVIDMFKDCNKLYYVKLFSTDAQRLNNVISQLPSHPDANEYDFIIDLSDNSNTVIEQYLNTFIPPSGWSIITGGDQ